MRSLLSLWLLGVCLVSPAAVRAGQPEEDEATLREARVPTEPAALVEFFKKRILPDNDADKVQKLIHQLGDDRFSVREHASELLTAMGPGVARLLKQSLNNRDPEVAARCKEALEVVERTSTVPLLSAAARLLGHKKHPEAARVLLDFAPIAESDDVVEAIRLALTGVAQREGKPEPLLVATLADKSPLRRSLAADALIRTGGLEGDAARKLLTDADVTIRLRAALALVERRDREAVPTLIELLGTGKLQQAWQAEDILFRLAGDKAPQVSIGEDEASRKTARAEWDKWWKENAASVDLKKLGEKQPFQDLTVIAYQDNTGQSRIMEQDNAGKTNWDFGGLSYPVTSVQMVRNDRVLLAEVNGARVTERNRKGEVLWRKDLATPVACQRLINGNTMIATNNGVYEFNAQGKEVFSYLRNRYDIMSAKKHRNGEYILMTRTHVVRLNARKEEAGSWLIGRNFSYCSFDILPNGNVLIPISAMSRVVEYSLDGKEVWSAAIQWPTSVQRLPSGNTLVCSMNSRTINELDKTGKVVTTRRVDGTPWAIMRR